MTIVSMAPMWLMGFLLLPTSALAQDKDSHLSADSVQRAIRLLDSLYLRPEEIDAARLLGGAAKELEYNLPWLLTEVEDRAIYLEHGNGQAIGNLTVGDMQTLPGAVEDLTTLLQESGHPTEDVDLRLQALKGITNELGKYTKIMSGERLKRFDTRLKGTLVGIGATLTIEDDHLLVRELLDDGPAKKGGLQPQDIITRIDGVSTTNMPMNECTKRIRGDIDTVVTLTVKRTETTLEFALKRAKVTIPNVIAQSLEGDIGYLRITHFSQKTLENLRSSLQRLRNDGALGKGLVLDLRRNTGGSMKQAARAADEFLREGLLIRTVGRDGKRVRNLQERMQAINAGDEPTLPIIILVDRKTASGSEILAGSLAALNRAVIIGQPTFGKSTVQKIYTLDKNTSMKMTVAQYLLAGDWSVGGVGVSPDLSIEKVVLDEYGMRYRRWSDERIRDAHAQALTIPMEDQEWAGRSLEQSDTLKELARRALLKAPSAKRSLLRKHLLSTAITMGEELSDKLTSAMQAKGMDWSLPTTDEPGAELPEVEVRLSQRADPDRQDVIIVDVVLENKGDRPIHQGTVVLHSDTLSAWSGIAVPLGTILPGEQAHGSGALPLRAGIGAREDLVQLHLLAYPHHNQLVGQEILTAQSTPKPQLILDAHLEPDGEDLVAILKLLNPSENTLTRLEASFRHPGDQQFELIEGTRWLPELGPKQTGTLQLRLRAQPDATENPILHLSIKEKEFGRLLNWELELPRDGTTLHRQAPRISTKNIPLSSTLGALEVDISVSDDEPLQEVVVYHNANKARWVPGGKTSLSFSTVIELEAGQNTIMIIARDPSGLETRHKRIIRGEIGPPSLSDQQAP